MRELSRIEQALTLSHIVYPMTAVCVLRLTGAPPAGKLRQALDLLQRKQPLLRSSIIRKGSSYYFVPLESETEIPLSIIERISENQWEAQVRSEINTGWGNGAGPLMKAVYLKGQTDGNNAEILLAFHHAVADHISILFLVESILRVAAGMEFDPGADAGVSEYHSPRLESRLPRSFKGIFLLPRLFRVVLSQLREEKNYRKHTILTPDHPIPETSLNDILTIRFNEQITGGLVRWSRQNRISLNSMIGAALIIAVNCLRYSGNDKWMRLILFAGLRHYLRPSVSPCEMGSMISMLRFTFPVSRDQDFPDLARQLNGAVEKSVRRGDPFIFALLSKLLIRQTIRKQDARLGHAALSYVGPLKLAEKYGTIGLSGIHAFITNNRLGPEFTGFGKIFRGELSLDLNFLTSEMTREEAEGLAAKIYQLLTQQISEI